MTSFNLNCLFKDPGSKSSQLGARASTQGLQRDITQLSEGCPFSPLSVSSTPSFCPSLLPPVALRSSPSLGAKTAQASSEKPSSFWDWSDPKGQKYLVGSSTRNPCPLAVPELER